MLSSLQDLWKTQVLTGYECKKSLVHASKHLRFFRAHILLPTHIPIGSIHHPSSTKTYSSDCPKLPSKSTSKSITSTSHYWIWLRRKPGFVGGKHFHIQGMLITKLKNFAGLMQIITWMKVKTSWCPSILQGLAFQLKKNWSSVQFGL